MSTCTCSACGIEQPVKDGEVYPENGWVLPYETFGYYGGFSDEVDVLLGQRQSRQWIFCHDCIIKFLELFPALDQSNIEYGSHLCESDVSCCKWSWRGTELFGKAVWGVHVQRGDGSGGWIDDAPTGNLDWITEAGIDYEIKPFFSSKDGYKNFCSWKCAVAETSQDELKIVHYRKGQERICPTCLSVFPDWPH
jgi:hypothetical protein